MKEIFYFKFFLVFSLVFIFIFASFKAYNLDLEDYMKNSNNNGNSDGSKMHEGKDHLDPSLSVVFNGKTYVSNHSRIEFNNNSDMINWFAGNYSMDGTKEKPYIFENLTIGDGTKCCIILNNVSLHLTIRNCVLFNRISSKILYLNSSKNIIFSNNLVIECGETAIECLYSSNDTISYNTLIKTSIYLGSRCNNFNISNNYISGYEYAINIQHDSPNNLIWNNVLFADYEGSGCVGILVNSPNNTILKNSISIAETGIKCINSNNTISKNRISKCSHNGILLNSSSNNNISENNIFECGEEGIYVFDGTNNSIIRNRVLYCSNKGISLISNSTNNTLSENIISHGNWGIYIDNDCTNNTIFSNIVFKNMIGQAYDNGTNNRWDNGSAGNFWGDYRAKYSFATFNGNIWNTIYEIDGDADSNDSYPCVLLRYKFDFNLITLTQGSHNIEIKQEGKTSFTVNSSISVKDTTELFYGSYTYNPTNISLSNDLFFVELSLNDSDNLNGNLNLTFNYQGTKALTELKCWWFNPSAKNGNGEWQEVPIDKERNLVSLSVDHASIFAISGIDSADGGVSGGNIIYFTGILTGVIKINPVPIFRYFSLLCMVIGIIGLLIYYKKQIIRVICSIIPSFIFSLISKRLKKLKKINNQIVWVKQLLKD